MRVPRTARRSNQSVLKEINPEYSLEGRMLKLKLQDFWPPDAKNFWKRVSFGEDPDAGEDGRQEEKGTIEDEMVAWHHQLDGHEFEETAGNIGGQRSLVFCSPRGHKESDTTERVNNSGNTR